MGKQKKNPQPPNPLKNKPPPVEKARKKQMSAPALSIDGAFGPSKYGVVLRSAEAKVKWGPLVRLQHKQCRFLHMPTIAARGIADDVIALSTNVGLYRLFTADYLAYKSLTLEFLSMVEVFRENGTPRRMTFQLGNEPRSLTVEELNTLVNGPEPGYYLGDHTFDDNAMWKKICHMPAERLRYFNSMVAKATSIRNPIFRYFHRLLSSTLLSRLDVGTVLSNEMHIIVAATQFVHQSAGCFLANHIEK